ncbi:MAG: hypothetical protein U9N45_07310, partial [Gemmatimonadota bacterium]|nr:hypothetical protein [Gemmatimonadota bacterium]
MAEYPHILAGNLLQEATVAITDDTGGLPLDEDAVYRLNYLADRSRLSKWYCEDYSKGIRVTFAFSSPQEADTWVLDKNFVIPGASAAVQLQSSEDGSSWSAVDTIPAPLASD